MKLLIFNKHFYQFNLCFTSLIYESKILIFITSHIYHHATPQLLQTPNFPVRLRSTTPKQHPDPVSYDQTQLPPMESLLQRKLAPHSPHELNSFSSYASLLLKH